MVFYDLRISLLEWANVVDITFKVYCTDTTVQDVVRADRVLFAQIFNTLHPSLRLVISNVHTYILTCCAYDTVFPLYLAPILINPILNQREEIDPSLCLAPPPEFSQVT